MNFCNYSIHEEMRDKICHMKKGTFFMLIADEKKKVIIETKSGVSRNSISQKNHTLLKT